MSEPEPNFDNLIHHNPIKMMNVANACNDRLIKTVNKGRAQNVPAPEMIFALFVGFSDQSEDLTRAMLTAAILRLAAKDESFVPPPDSNGDRAPS